MRRFVVVVFVGLGVSGALGDEPVSFRSPGLKAAVETQLHVSNPTAAEMLKLVYLVAEGRDITDLAGLEHAANLATLNLGSNAIADLSALAPLTRLTRLYLHGNAISDLSPLAGLSRLQFLSLAGNRILDMAPLARLAGLRTLDLSANALTDISPLASLPAPVELKLSYNYITDVAPLASLVTLTDLDLGLNDLTDITPLASLTRLERLRLGNNRIRDIAPLASLTALGLLALEWDNPLNAAARCVYLPRIERANPGLTLFVTPDWLPPAGDFTFDARVTLPDLAILASSWRQPVPYPSPLDFDLSGDVAPPDLSAFSGRWLAPIEVREFHLDAHPGWTASGQWQFGAPQGRGGHSLGYPDPNVAHTGANVFGVNLAGDCDPSPCGPHYLTTGPIDCRGFTRVTLTFARRLNTDDAGHARATLELSTDGLAWRPLWQQIAPEPLIDATWTPMSYSLSPHADNQPTIYLRWGYEVLDNARPHSGWNLDDVILWASH